MSELIVQAGSWTAFNAAEAEAFLASVSRLLGFSQEHQDFLKKVKDDIHGYYTPSKFYYETLSIIIQWIPTMILKEINKDCDADHKRQIKMWYHELINMNSSKDSPFYNLLIPTMTKLVEQL